MIINISDRKDTKFLLYSNTLSVEIKFHWQIIAFFLLYRWHSYINNVSLFTLVAILPEKTTSRIKYHDLINLLHTCADGGFSPPNPSVFSGIRLFILIYQKIAVLC